MQESEQSEDAESSAQNNYYYYPFYTATRPVRSSYTAARIQRNLLSSVGRRDHIMDIALKGLLESTTRVMSGIALDSAWLELQVRLFQM